MDRNHFLENLLHYWTRLRHTFIDRLGFMIHLGFIRIVPPCPISNYVNYEVGS